MTWDKDSLENVCHCLQARPKAYHLLQARPKPANDFTHAQKPANGSTYAQISTLTETLSLVPEI